MLIAWFRQPRARQVSNSGKRSQSQLQCFLFYGTAFPSQCCWNSFKFPPKFSSFSQMLNNLFLCPTPFSHRKNLIGSHLHTVLMSKITLIWGVFWICCWNAHSGFTVSTCTADFRLYPTFFYLMPCMRTSEFLWWFAVRSFRRPYSDQSVILNLRQSLQYILMTWIIVMYLDFNHCHSWGLGNTSTRRKPWANMYFLDGGRTWCKGECACREMGAHAWASGAWLQVLKERWQVGDVRRCSACACVCCLRGRI